MRTVGFLVAILVVSGILSFVSLAFLLMGTKADQGDLALVIPYPWGPEASEIITRSGMVETYPVRAPFGSLTVINTPGDLTKLRELGAWFILDGKKVAEICSAKV